MMRKPGSAWVLLVLVPVLGAAGCSADSVMAPSSAVERSGADATSSTGYTPPTVTFRSDLTVSPSRVAVRVNYPVRMVNQSGRGVRVHSYNCSEFSTMALTPGASKNTMVFKPAGKTCDYFVWDTNWSRKIFEGQVVVQ